MKLIQKKNEFEKDSYELMVFSVIGKIMQSNKNQIDIQLVTNEKQEQSCFFIKILRI